jgi:hypothetical protein
MKITQNKPIIVVKTRKYGEDNPIGPLLKRQYCSVITFLKWRETAWEKQNTRKSSDLSTKLILLNRVSLSRLIFLGLGDKIRKRLEKINRDKDTRFNKINLVLKSLLFLVFCFSHAVSLHFKNVITEQY